MQGQISTTSRHIAACNMGPPATFLRMGPKVGESIYLICAQRGEKILRPLKGHKFGLATGLLPLFAASLFSLRFSLKFGLEATPLQTHTSSSDICGVWFGFGSGFGIDSGMVHTSPRHHPLTHYLSPPPPLLRSGQTSPHKPRLGVSPSTCPPPRAQLCNRFCSNKQQLLPLPG
jgi:hypothetical protein